VTATPTFFLGTTTSDSHISVRWRINGAAPFPTFSTIVRGLMMSVKRN
jgi:hypothetical protein